MTSIKITRSKPKQKEFTVHGKKRIIRDIRENKPNEFEAFYKQCLIRVCIDERNHLYATCIAPDGGYIVDGYLGEDWWSDKRKIAYGIKECLENILCEEK